MAFIYTLIDPINGEIRYIGKTISTLDHRLSQHIYSSKKGSTHRDRWINSLINKGIKPIIQKLQILNESDLTLAEQYWIKYFKNKKVNLCNHTEGGEGTSGYKHTKEQIQKNSEAKKKNPINYWKNKKRSEETKQKIKDILTKKLGKAIIDQFGCIYPSIREAARILGCFRQNIQRIIDTNKTFNGYKFRKIG